MSSAPDLARFCVDWVRSMDRITNYTSLIGGFTQDFIVSHFRFSSTIPKKYQNSYRFLVGKLQLGERTVGVQILSKRYVFDPNQLGGNTNKSNGITIRSTITII